MTGPDTRASALRMGRAPDPARFPCGHGYRASMGSTVASMGSVGRGLQPAIDADACVIGGGVNGLVAAIAMADAGWDVVLVEGAELGGAVRSVRRRPETVTDMFSAFYPLTAISPVIRALELAQHGLEWSHAPVVVAHPPAAATTTAAALYRDVAQTARGLDEDHPGDGGRWEQAYDDWLRLREPLLDALFSPFPPLGPAARLARVLGMAEGIRTARFLLLPVHRMAIEMFRGEHGRLLLTGNALHADIPTTAPGSGMFGWLLTMLGQDVGYPVPRGGAGELVVALVRRARAAGVQIEVGAPVDRVLLAGGGRNSRRAVGVALGDGRLIRARRATVAAIDAPTLFQRLLPRDAVPDRLHEDLAHFDRDLPTVKVNWTLPRTPHWTSTPTADAGTVHVGTDFAGAVQWSGDLESGRVGDRPFMLLGQMTTADETRSTDGSESVWAYTHLPRGCTVEKVGADAVAAAVRTTVDGMEAVLEAHAPGFADGALDRFVQGPADLHAANPNLVDGGVNGGTAQLHQQLIFRPVPGMGRPNTPIEGLYLGGSSAHPGGGVHGACGWNAAVTVLADHGVLGPLRRKAASALQDRLYRDRPDRVR